MMSLPKEFTDGSTANRWVTKGLVAKPKSFANRHQEMIVRGVVELQITAKTKRRCRPACEHERHRIAIVQAAVAHLFSP